MSNFDLSEDHNGVAALARWHAEGSTPTASTGIACNAAPLGDATAERSALARETLLEYVEQTARATTLCLKDAKHCAKLHVPRKLCARRVAEAVLAYMLRFFEAEPRWDSPSTWQVVALCALRAWSLYYVSADRDGEDMFAAADLLFLHQRDDVEWRRRVLWLCQLDMACTTSFALSPCAHDFEACLQDVPVPSPALAPVAQLGATDVVNGTKDAVSAVSASASRTAAGECDARGRDVCGRENKRARVEVAVN